MDVDELVVLAIIYAEKDRPSTGEHLEVEVTVPEGYLLKLDRDIPHITNQIMDFGNTEI